MGFYKVFIDTDIRLEAVMVEAKNKLDAKEKVFREWGGAGEAVYSFAVPKRADRKNLDRLQRRILKDLPWLSYLIREEAEDRIRKNNYRFTGNEEKESYYDGFIVGTLDLMILKDTEFEAEYRKQKEEAMIAALGEEQYWRARGN